MGRIGDTVVYVGIETSLRIIGIETIMPTSLRPIIGSDTRIPIIIPPIIVIIQTIHGEYQKSGNTKEFHTGKS